MEQQDEQIKKICLKYKEAIKLFEEQFKFKNEISQHKIDIFEAFLSDWKNKVEQFEKKMNKKEDTEKDENLSNLDEFDFLYDQFSLINQEIENGHYYQDSSQFHGIHRQFQDMHLKYDPTVEYIQLD